MADDGLQPPRDMEAELEDLGPLMAQQEMALEAEPDPEFVRSLRNRLTGEAQPARPVRERRTGRLASWARRYAPVAGGLAAAAVVLLVVLLRNGSGSPGTTPVQTAFHLPRPGTADITRSYPSLGGLGAGPPPIWGSNLQPPPGAPYAGPLTLRGSPLPSGPEQVAAYRLDGPRFDLPSLPALARTLGISGSVRHITVGKDRWAYIAEQSGPTRLHSIAVNTRTGELIYHDTRGTAPIPRSVTDKELMEARTWLSTLGWPGGRMSLRQSATEQERTLFWVLRFNWPNLAANLPAASVALDATGKVTDAVLEPPIQAAERVTLQSRQAAWTALRERGGPIGVEGMVGVPPEPGTATLAHSWVTYVLTHGADGRAYLVPAYRFEGTATIHGIPGTKRWLAIVPAVK